MPQQSRAPECRANAVSTGRKCTAAAAKGTPYCKDHQDPATRMPEQASTADRPAAGSASLSGSAATAPDALPAGATLAAMSASAVTGGKPATKKHRPVVESAAMTDRERVQFFLRRHLNSDKTPLLRGDIGVGKTSLVADLAEQEGMELIKMDMIAIAEQSQITGLPALEFDDELGRTILTRVFEEQFEKLRQAREMEDKGHEPPGYIVFFDEFTAAPRELSTAVLNLFSQRQLGQWILPTKCWLIAAGNTVDHSKHAKPMPEALRDRFKFIDMERAPWEEAQGWVDEQMETGRMARYSPEKKARVRYWMDIIGGFLKYNPGIYDDEGTTVTRKQTGDKFPTPRSMVDTSEVLADTDEACEFNEEIAKTFYRDIVKQCVGDEVARGFTRYVRELDLPNPEEWLAKPQLAGEFAKANADRLDKVSIVLNRLTGIIDGLQPPAGMSNQEIMQWRQDNAVAAGLALCHIVEANEDTSTQALARFNLLMDSEAFKYADETDEKVVEVITRGSKIFKGKLEAHNKTVKSVLEAKAKSKAKAK